LVGGDVGWVVTGPAGAAVLQRGGLPVCVDGAALRAAVGAECPLVRLQRGAVCQLAVGGGVPSPPRSSGIFACDVFRSSSVVDPFHLPAAAASRLQSPDCTAERQEEGEKEQRMSTCGFHANAAVGRYS
jgi:hypothetical protein